jgi:hypothetical protein
LHVSGAVSFKTLTPKYKSVVIMERKEERPEREKSLSSVWVKRTW